MSGLPVLCRIEAERFETAVVRLRRNVASATTAKTEPRTPTPRHPFCFARAHGSLRREGARLSQSAELSGDWPALPRRDFRWTPALQAERRSDMANNR